MICNRQRINIEGTKLGSVHSGNLKAIDQTKYQYDKERRLELCQCRKTVGRLMTLLPQKFKVLHPHRLSAVVYVDMLISQLYLSTSSTLIRLAERKNRETVSISMLLSKREFRINYDLGLELSKILLTLSHLEGE